MTIHLKRLLLIAIIAGVSESGFSFEAERTVCTVKSCGTHERTEKLPEGPVVHTSVNPKLDPSASISEMLFLDYRLLFDIKSDFKNGIIAPNVNAGGYVILQAFSYDPSKPDGLGAEIFSMTENSSSEEYGDETTHDVSISMDTKGLLVEFTKLKSNDIKRRAQAAGIFAEDWNNPCSTYSKSWLNCVINVLDLETGCAPLFKSRQPVIVKITYENVQGRIGFKIPGIGEFYNYNDVFQTIGRHFAEVEGDVTVGCHRGFWEGVTDPENTIKATTDALTKGYGMIELDLWLTKDDYAIVFHDMGLNKRTTQTGPVRERSWEEIKDLLIKNRFDEVINSTHTRMERLGQVFSNILTHINKETWFNLDRAANDMATFKVVYPIVKQSGMLHRSIFKGRYDPVNPTTMPTINNLRQAFSEMYPHLNASEIDNEIRLMFFTPVLFDNAGANYDEQYAQNVKNYIDEWIAAGYADGFELTFKAYPEGSPQYATNSNADILMLRSWQCLGNKNFVEYVHEKGYPVGIFATAPEFCAIPDYNTLTDGSRNPNTLVSGFLKEDATHNYNPKVTDQPMYDFRGDWDFYIPAGADYVLTDRPDALLVYLKAIGRHN